MAKITYGSALTPHYEIASMYGTGAFAETSKTEGTWVEGSGGDLVHVEGKNLKFIDGALVSGTVTRVEFTDFEHAKYGTIKGEFDAKAFLDVNTFSWENVIERLSKGNDQINGTDNGDYLEGHKGGDVIKAGAGDDLIWAGYGNDKIYGGAGTDYFYFSSGPGMKNEGHDTVYGFDAKGGFGKQDFISSEIDVKTIRKEGHDVVVEFDDGGSITLIDVKRVDVSEADFAFAL